MANPWTAVFGNVSYRAWKVWMRDLEVYRTTWKTNFLPPLLEPVLYVLAFGVGMGRLVGDIEYQGAVLSYLQFMFPGVIAVAVMFWAFFETTYASFIRMYYQRTFEAIASELRDAGATLIADRLDTPTALIHAIAMPRLSGQAQLMRFDMAGIAVSQGSACSSGTLRTSHVLEAMGVEPEIAERTIRVSFGWNTTRAEVERLCEVWLDMARGAA